MNWPWVSRHRLDAALERAKLAENHLRRIDKCYAETSAEKEALKVALRESTIALTRLALRLADRLVAR